MLRLENKLYDDNLGMAMVCKLYNNATEKLFIDFEIHQATESIIREGQSAPAILNLWWYFTEKRK